MNERRERGGARQRGGFRGRSHSSFNRQDYENWEGEKREMNAGSNTWYNSRSKSGWNNSNSSNDRWNDGDSDSFDRSRSYQQNDGFNSRNDDRRERGGARQRGGFRGRSHNNFNRKDDENWEGEKREMNEGSNTWYNSRSKSGWNNSNSSNDRWNDGNSEQDASDSYERSRSYPQNDGFGGRRGGRGFRREDQRPEGPVETINIPSREVGRLIGKGGSTIRELQEESGCHIKVPRDQDGYMIPVAITGSSDAIEKLKELMVDLNITIDGEAEKAPEVETPTEPGKPRPRIDWNKMRQGEAENRMKKFEGLPPILKNFYDENPRIAALPLHEVEERRKHLNNIIVEAPGGGSAGVANPVETFEDAFQNYPGILSEIAKQNFVEPSPIQCQSWPILLQGHDLIGIAQTGTGKTLAFLLPALIHIDSQPIPRSERTGPSALVLSPTRELAQQIEMEVNKINYKGIRSICVYGGGNRREQLQKIKKGVEIVVATPGRLNDFMNNSVLDVTNVTYLVMDEADRMLDLGFEIEIKKVMLDIRPDRQTVMTSATWPPEVQKLSDRYMTNPYKVYVGTLDLAAVHSVRQVVEMVDEQEKKLVLLDFIAQMEPDDKVIVFCGKKAVADDVSSDLSMESIECQCIHGDRDQSDRETALREFKDGTVRILVATDVASRGIDVKDITHVINFDFPRHIEEYVHRVGRTGRAGRTGTAITFVTRNDWRSAQRLINIMAEANQEIPDELIQMAERYSAFRERQRDNPRGRGRGGGRGRRDGGRSGGDDDFFMF